MGSILYRTAFAIFIIACLLSANDAYTSTLQVNYGLKEGTERMSEAWAFVGLAAILTFETVGLIMYRWLQRSIKQVTA